MSEMIVGLDQDEREHEVEITPEMIKAGASEIVHYNYLDDDPRDWVVLVYEAMEKARLASHL